MQRVDHRPELGHLSAGLPGPDRRRVARVRGEVADRAVAPVVRQAAVDQELLGHVLVHREQLDGGHAEVGEVRDRGRMGQPGVGAAQFLRDVGMGGGETLDVHLVDHGVGERVPGAGRWQRQRSGRDDGGQHEAAGHAGGRVERARGGRVGRNRGRTAPGRSARRRGTPGVRVEQQLVRVVAQPLAGVERAGHPVPVGLAGLDARHEAVPDLAVALGQGDLPLGAVGVEQAEQHLIAARADREVDAVRRQGRPQRGGIAGQRLPGSDRSGAVDVQSSVLDTHLVLRPDRGCRSALPGSAADRPCGVRHQPAPPGRSVGTRC